jgi:hypothetical protein
MPPISKPNLPALLLSSEGHRPSKRSGLNLGEAKANAQVVGFLFKSAENGNVSAQIFWLKTRSGGRRRLSSSTQALLGEGT